MLSSCLACSSPALLTTPDLQQRKQMRQLGRISDVGLSSHAVVIKYLKVFSGDIPEHVHVCEHGPFDQAPVSRSVFLWSAYKLYLGVEYGTSLRAVKYTRLNWHVGFQRNRCQTSRGGGHMLTRRQKDKHKDNHKVQLDFSVLGESPSVALVGACLFVVCK